MKRFKIKEPNVTAIQWDGTNKDEVTAFLKGECNMFELEYFSWPVPWSFYFDEFLTLQLGDVETICLAAGDESYIVNSGAETCVMHKNLFEREYEEA